MSGSAQTKASSMSSPLPRDEAARWAVTDIAANYRLTDVSTLRSCKDRYIAGRKADPAY